MPSIARSCCECIIISPHDENVDEGPAFLNQMLGFSFQGLHANLKPAPHGPAVLIIHGTLDTVVPFSDGLKLLKLIPHTRMVKVGDSVGQIDSLDFGHNWFEY